MRTGWPGFLGTVTIAIAVIAIVPLAVTPFTLLQLTSFAAFGILSLSLALIWGYGGIMCFGQAAFFGIGGYTYAVGALDLNDSTLPLALAVVVPAVAAAILGYFMFYGRVTAAYVGVMTLTVTVILFNVLNSTADDIYHIGAARLGGFNGMPSIPTLNWPGNADDQIGPAGTWIVTAGTLLVIYMLLRLMFASSFGKIVVGIRENETRAELLGFDVRWYKLVVFTIGGAIAGLGGAFFTNWGSFVSPSVFSINLSAQVIIFVLVGGIGTLVGPVLGAVAIEWLVAALGTQHMVDPNLILGLILVLFVLLVPRGILPSVGQLGARFRRDRSLQSAAQTGRTS